jgi:GPH family glycoside/pentoside/hexuronide:cation symporter
MATTDESRDKIPLSQTALYGVGQMAHQIFDSGVGYLALYVFNISLGVSPVLVGVAQAISRGIDLFTDPLAGYLADSSRRHPWRLRLLIAAGTVLGGISFALIWLFPAGLTKLGYFFWLLGCFALASVGWSFCSIPRQALGFEMSRNSYQRAKLLATASMLALVWNMVMAWSYWATQRPIFGGTVNGARWVGGGMGLAIILFGLPFALFYRTKPSAEPAAVVQSDLVRAAGPKDFLRAIQRVRQCRPFLIIAGVVALVIIAMLSSTYGVCHVLALYYMSAGSQAHASVLLGSSSTAWILAGLACTAPAVWTSRRVGKKATLMGALVISFVGAGLKWVCYDPRWPWLFVIPHACFGIGIGVLAALVPAMTADICDGEEAISGARDSGMFSAFYNWTIKLGISVSIALSGVLLNLSGFNVAAGRAQLPQTILTMRLVDIGFPAVLFAAAIALLCAYRTAPSGPPTGRTGPKDPELAATRT